MKCTLGTAATRLASVDLTRLAENSMGLTACGEGNKPSLVGDRAALQLPELAQQTCGGINTLHDF